MPRCCSASRCRRKATRASSIKSMYGRSEIDIRFPTPIPVHITYQTAFVDDSGQLQIREDLYGRDARLLTALKEDRRQAEIPIARVQPNQGRPARPVAAAAMRRYSSAGQSFFDRSSVIRYSRCRRPRPAAPGQPQHHALVRIS